MEPFNFMPQTASVEKLLLASQAALAHLPANERPALVAALRQFESVAAPTTWSMADVHAITDSPLTDGEKAQVLARFVENYECTESDWMALETQARNVLAERQLFVRVRFDPLYTGGVYQGSGQYAYLPLDLVQAMALEDPDGDDGVARAFTETTRLDARHTLDYSLSELYNQHGEVVELPSEYDAAAAE